MIGHGVCLLLVPLVRGGANHVGGEPVHPVAQILLVLGERQREGRLLVGRAGDRLDSRLGCLGVVGDGGG